MRKNPILPFLTVLFFTPFMSGCVVALALVGAAAGAATKAVSYSLNGIAYRTFTTPLPKVQSATLAALERMGIKVEEEKTTEEGGEIITASGSDRQIEVELEAISPKTTRMRTVAKQGVFFRDRATAVEIILQTENVLAGQTENVLAGK
jgi:hypothetical protein